MKDILLDTLILMFGIGGIINEFAKILEKFIKIK